MARCDFSTMIGIIRRYIKEGSKISQPDLIGELFYSFYCDNASFEIDNAQINRWIKGSAPVSPAVSEYYRRKNGADKLCSDIENFVFPLLSDKDMAAQEVYNLVISDIGISENKRSELIQKYPQNNAAFLAEVLIFTFDRAFKKQEADILVTGNSSPVATERIIGGEPPKPCKYFCGRDAELEELHTLLSENDKVFVTGIAGIGKSEFVKAYAKRYNPEYTNILYYTYGGSLKQLVTDIMFADDISADRNEEKFRRHDSFLRALKEDTLLIIDNFNAMECDDAFLAEVLNYRCRVIFTARGRFESGSTFELNEIKSADTLAELFGKFYPAAESCLGIVSEIIETVHHHTFIVELAARHLQKGLIKPDELLAKLKESSVNPHTTDKIKMSKDGIGSKETYYDHLRALFSLSALNEQMQTVMRCMVFAESSGIDARLFAAWLKLSDLNEINDLIELGYINEADTDKIALLPIMRDIVLEELKPSYLNCAVFLRSVHSICLQIGLNVPYSKTLLAVIENIVKYISVDTIPDHINFLQTAFSFMEKYAYESGMRLIADETESVLKNESIGTSADRAALYIAKASCARLFDGDNETAIKLCEKALSYCVPENEPLLASNIYMNIGLLYQESGQLTPARENMEKSIAFMRNSGVLTNNTVINTRNYARLLFQTGETAQAAQNLENCIEKLKKSGFDNITDYADICFDLGSFAIYSNDIPAANERFAAALKIYAENLDKAEFERIVTMIADCYKTAGAADMPDFLKTAALPE